MTGIHIKYVAVCVGLFVMAALSTACQDKASTDKSACTESAQLYWKTFRNAVLKNDQQLIVGMTQFPFRLSVGHLDADRREELLDREVFIKVFPKLLLADPGISNAQKTMRGYVTSDLSIPMPSKACSADGELFRVGDWVFELKASGWRFVQAYLAEGFNQ